MEKIKTTDSKIDWRKMSEYAWKTRENSHILGETKVGASLITNRGTIFSGCNVEHMFRSHDIHAETNAIGNMVTAGEKVIVAILVVATRTKFTPCGSCMDWIFQFGGPECEVGFQSEPNAEVRIYKAGELMPHYPV